MTAGGPAVLCYVAHCVTSSRKVEHNEGLTRKQFVDIQGDLAGKLLEALAHAEISNALHMAVKASLNSHL